MEHNCTNIYSVARKRTLMANGKPITQQKVAEILGISRDAVAKWETGDTIPTEKNVAKLAQIYGPGIAYQHLLFHSALGPYLPEIEKMCLREASMRLMDSTPQWADYAAKAMHICMDGKVDKSERKAFEDATAFFIRQAGLCMSLAMCSFKDDEDD